MPFINRRKPKAKEEVVGEMTISGESEARVRLERGRPERFQVNFIDDQNQNISCAPQSIDLVDADIVERQGGVDLVIVWNVSGVRRIQFKLFY
jgi:hypothetical protein